MKRLLPILLLLTINLTVLGQHNLGLKANVGLSRISNSFDPSNSTWTVQFAPSGHGGLFYDLQLTGKSILGIELLFVQIEGKEKNKTDLIDIDGNKIGHFTSDLYKHISYLSLPAYYGLKFNNLTITVGFQVSFALASSARSKVKVTYNGDVTNSDYKGGKLNIDIYDFGPRAGIIFNLNKKFAMEGTYYYGVNNILDNDGPPWAWTVQQATVGFRYTFLTKPKNKKE